MQRINPNAPDTTTENPLAQLIRTHAPEDFADGKLNLEVLQQLLGDQAEDEEMRQEHFGLNWPGKAKARRFAMEKPLGSTLKSVLGEGLDEKTTHNIFIEGDNLQVLKLLRESYADSIKMIYIDPPYNTGKDFIYKDNLTESIDAYLRRTGQKDGEQPLVSNPRSEGRFHSNWLNFMYPRLKVAKDLLKEDGVIFVSIDDNEIHNTRQIMNEIFGEENFITCLVWQKSKKGDVKLIANSHEYVLVYCKDKACVIENGTWRKKKLGADDVLEQYRKFKNEFKDNHSEISQAISKWYNLLSKDDPRKAHKHYRFSDYNGLYFAADFAGPDDGRKSRPRYEIIHPVTGKPCKKPSTGWRWDEERTREALSRVPSLIHFGVDETTIPCRKTYLQDLDNESFSSVFYKDGRSATLQVEKLIGKGIFDFPKDTEVIQDFLEIIQDKNATVLDFFGGSGSTAHAVLEQNNVDVGNRKFILVQLPEHTSKGRYQTISEVCKERIKQAAFNLKSQGAMGDLGFKVFKLDASNYKPWKDFQGNNPSQLIAHFNEAAKSPLVDGWKSADLLTEILLLEGFPLHSTISPLDDYPHNQVVVVASDFTEHRLHICLDATIHADTISALRVPKGDSFICLDAALDDQAKMRLSDRCTLKTI